MSEPSLHWWYLRAYAVARSGGPLTDKAFYLTDGGEYEKLEFMAAMAIAARDAAAPYGAPATMGIPRSETSLSTELRSVLPPPKTDQGAAK